MTQSTIWSTLLANVIGKPIHTPMQPEGSLIGAAICAAKGVGHYPTLMDSAKNMVKWKLVSEPDHRTNLYETYYSKWKTMWCEGE
jgi:sugar (pentulose or hexulose) kinase